MIPKIERYNESRVVTLYLLMQCSFVPLISCTSLLWMLSFLFIVQEEYLYLMIFRGNISKRENFVFRKLIDNHLVSYLPIISHFTPLKKNLFSFPLIREMFMTNDSKIRI